ncbi:SIMPL domain-containing protein [Salirhabdus salicampi]|uniref:SIMPL domain-containing protein n=1 Tax=Salirhabdus salicampi TaxID=476102 RepID=UPI0020C2C315|nr:SIMPL domain-containing protein [Salirhabdus salicampi]MCP8615761.1 SIMPL domain-containing protein [Salirhabdus salicampi]
MNYDYSMIQSPRVPTRNHPSILKVYGEGKVNIEPNVAYITLGVITIHESLNTALSENGLASSRVIDALLQLQIDREHIQTKEFHVNMEYDYENGKQIFRGYRVTHMMIIQSNNISNIGQIVDKAISNGANYVSNIQFTVLQSDVYYEKALRMALQNAQKKASSTAETIGVSLHRTPERITELTSTSTPQTMINTMVSNVEFPTEPGMLSVSARVEVEYTYFS